MTSFREAAAAIRGPLEFALRGAEVAARVHDLAATLRAALEAGIPYFTTVAGARAAAAAIRALRAGEVQPIALQDLHTV